MKIKNILKITSIFTFLIVNHCQSQIFPKVKIKLDSLYPNAILEGLWLSGLAYTEVIGVHCKCQEFSGKMIIEFDTNGNILNKDYYFDNLKELPDTILNYIKKNTSLNRGFAKDVIIKSINNKGEVSYGIDMWESPNSYSRSDYHLNFKSTGELISKKNIDINQ